MKVSSGPTLPADPEPFLRRLFDALEEAGIGYVVLRNYESYPYRIQKPDVGLLVRNHDIGMLEREFRQVAAALGHAYRCKKDGANIISLYALQVFDRGDDWEVSTMKLHVRTFEPFVFTRWMHRIRGHNYKVFFDEVDTMMVDQGGCRFRVLAPVDSFVMLLKQWRRKQEPHHREALERAMDSDSLRFWYEAATGSPAANLSDTLDSPESEDFDSLLCQLAESRWGRRTAWRYITRQAATLRQLATRIIERQWRLAPMYYFSGPDGCGKTTTVKTVSGFLLSHGIRFHYFYTMHKLLRYLGFRCRWFLHLATTQKKIPFRKYKGIGGGHKERDPGTRAWKAAKLAGLLCSIVDVYIGWIWICVLRQQGIVVLVEASPHDLFVKYHMPEFPLLERIILPLIPSPRVGFLMTSRAQVIVARKPELTMDEIENYYERISLVHDRAKENHYIPIRTDISQTATTVTVLQAILGSLEEPDHV